VHKEINEMNKYDWYVIENKINKIDKHD